MAMALDEPTDFDEMFTVDGFMYIVDKRLLPMVQPITVDFNGYAFGITGSGIGAYSQCG